MESIIYDTGLIQLFQAETETESGFFYKDDVSGIRQIDKRTYYELIEGYFLNDEFIDSSFDITKMCQN